MFDLWAIWCSCCLSIPNRAHLSLSMGALCLVFGAFRKHRLCPQRLRYHWLAIKRMFVEYVLLCPNEWANNGRGQSHWEEHRTFIVPKYLLHGLSGKGRPINRQGLVWKPSSQSQCTSVREVCRASSVLKFNEKPCLDCLLSGCPWPVLKSFNLLNSLGGGGPLLILIFRWDSEVL